MKRLPIHPQPLPHEALSSWIDRLADAYDLPAEAFMEGAFGYSPLSDTEFDLTPPADLLVTIAERTGVPLGKIRAMTLEGYAPLLLDAMTPARGLFETYISQFPTFASVRHRFRRPTFKLDETSWLPWVPSSRAEQARLCRQCVARDPIPYRRIYWRAVWMTCCPDHGEMLTPGLFQPPRQDVYASAPRPSAPDAVVALDRLTLQAVTDGAVALPNRRTINAAVWVRALRTLVDELVRPAYTLASAKNTVAKAWQLAGLPLHAGLRQSRVFENLPPEQREQVMMVAAMAAENLLNGTIAPSALSVRDNAAATIFHPPPVISKEDLGSVPPRRFSRKSPSLNSTDWDDLWAAMRRAVDAARRSPLEAYYFRNLLALGRSGSKVEEVDKCLRDLGVPIIVNNPEGYSSRQRSTPDGKQRRTAAYRLLATGTYHIILSWTVCDT
jgi:hypothetical protein